MTIHIQPSIIGYKQCKLRSLISQDIMEAMLMINIERDYVVDKEIVVNTIATSSTKLSRLLI